MAVEKFILTVKELHLGLIKETFGKGAVIEYDTDKRRLTIDSRKFEEVRDLEILKRQARLNPDNPWIVPYSEESLAFYKGPSDLDIALPQPPEKAGTNMQVVQSDEDLMGTIDISETKITDAARIAAQAEVAKNKTGVMEIIRGDETVEDRIARLNAEEAAKEAAGKKKGNMAHIAAKTALLQSEPANMEIVHDDSLGSAGGTSSAALNAGMPVLPREDIEARDTAGMSEARKSEASTNRNNRNKMLADEGLPDDTEYEVAPAVATSDAPLEEAPSEAAVLKAENASLQKQMADMQAQMAQLLAQAPAAPAAETPAPAEAPAPAPDAAADVEVATEAVDRVPVTASEEAG